MFQARQVLNTVMWPQTYITQFVCLVTASRVHTHTDTHTHIHPLHLSFAITRTKTDTVPLKTDKRNTIFYSVVLYKANIIEGT